MLNSLEGATTLDETAVVAGMRVLVGAVEVAGGAVLAGRRALPKKLIVASNLGFFGDVAEAPAVDTGRGRFWTGGAGWTGWTYWTAGASPCENGQLKCRRHHGHIEAYYS